MQNNEHFDSVVNDVVNKYKDRAHTGLQKYNTTLDREDLNELQWLNHLQDELMDASLYVQKLKQIIEKRKNSL
jgi:hypothetical protein